MAGNCSETVVQLDEQEQPLEMKHRHVIIEAARKFSALAKGSASRTGKSFFPATKPSKSVMHPWLSTTNISHSAQTSIQAPISTPIVLEAASPWRKDSFKSFRQSSMEESEGRRPSVSSQSDRNQEGVVNSAFIEEKLHDVPDICDYDNMEEEYDNSGSPTPYKDSCQHLPIPEAIDMPVIGGEPSCLKYLKRDRSTSDSKKKKGIQWSRLSGKSLKFRRRTTDNIPTISTMMSQTRSSPNLSNLEERKSAQNVKIDPSYKQEDDSKL